MNFKIIPYSEDLDLTEFYQTAKSKGYENNSSKKILIDSISKERDWQVWFLTYNDKIVGSTGAHTFDEMGENSYRILCRTCVFTDAVPIPHMRTKVGIMEHKNITAQHFIPKCIEWAGENNNLYITSNDSEGGSQKAVHKVYMPLLAKLKQVEKIKDLPYRGHTQTVWKLNVKNFKRSFKKWI